MVCDFDLAVTMKLPVTDKLPLGSRGPAVLDDFTASFGYKFSDAAGYQWPVTSIPTRL